MALLDKLATYYRLFGWQGVSLSIKSRLARQPFETSVWSPALQHTLNLRLKTTDVVTYKKIFEDEEYGFSVPKEPSFIIDAGANIGLASIFLARKYPQARIFALEPEQENFKLLKKNISNYPNITAIQKALWKDTGTLLLVDPGIGPWGFQVHDTSTAPKGKVIGKIPAIGVQDLMKTSQIPYVDLLKMDIEGGEKELFEDCANWIGSVGSIMIELHDRMKIGCSRSFYLATKDFDFELHKGENVFVARTMFPT